LVENLCDDATRERVSDPVKFVSEVLDHLPPGAASLGQQRTLILSRVHLGLALWNYGLGKTAEAKRQLVDALTLCPSMFEQSEEFAKLLGKYAMRLPVSDPLQYVETVFKDLPAGAQLLKNVKPRVLDEVNLACAFEDYAAGRKRQVVRRVFKAWRSRPSWLRNRGVASIFVRSLPGLLTQ
jgi:hypothetical protein